MAELPQAARDYIRQQGREWARNNPDPVRRAEVTALLRQLKPRRQVAEPPSAEPEA